MAHHIAVTQDLADDDPRKFSRRTPKVQTDSYLRLMHPETGVSPTPDQIKTDMEKCLGDPTDENGARVGHLWRIYEARGTVVPRSQRISSVPSSVVFRRLTD